MYSERIGNRGSGSELYRATDRKQGIIYTELEIIPLNSPLMCINMTSIHDGMIWCSVPALIPMVLS